MTRRDSASRAVEWAIEQQGWLAGRADRKRGPTSQDWPGNQHGFIDVILVRHGQPGTMYVQSTTKHNKAARLKKMLAESHSIRTMILSGNQVELWCWSGDWDEPERTVITLEMLEPTDG